MEIYFEKVSLEQFIKDSTSLVDGQDLSDDEVRSILTDLWEQIKLPTRGTDGSAGYDFYFPYLSTVVAAGHTELIPTGIRAFMSPGVKLDILPRSGTGFKTGVHLANTIGLIDSDYYYADNEGHIMVKLVGGFKDLELNHLDRFCQGCFTPYFTVTKGDVVINPKRVGGFGSTDKK